MNDILKIFNEIKEIVALYDDMVLVKSKGIELPEKFKVLEGLKDKVENYRDFIKKAEGNVPEEYKFVLDKDFQKQLGELGSDEEKIKFAASTLKDYLSQQVGEDKAQEAISSDIIQELVGILQELGLVGEEGGGEATEDGSEEKSEGEGGKEETEEGKDGGEPEGQEQVQSDGTPVKEGEEEEGKPGLFDETKEGGEGEQTEQPIPPTAAIMGTAGQGGQAGTTQQVGNNVQEIEGALTVLLRAVAASMRA